MFRNRLLTLFALFLLVAFGVQAASGAQFGAGTDDVPVTQWVSVNGELPTSYAEWAAQQPPAAPDHVELMMETPPPSVEPPAAVGKVALIINSSIYNQLSGEIATWQADLQNEGWTVSVYSSTFSQPNALRSFLAGIANLKGAVLVGSFPVPGMRITISRTVGPRLRSSRLTSTTWTSTARGPTVTVTACSMDTAATKRRRFGWAA